MRNATLAVLLALLTLAAPAAAATNPPSTPAGPARTAKPATPVGIITFNATLVGVGATFTWGRGWLTYKGQNYPIRLDGLGIIGLGVSKIQATGKVYHLKRPEDLAGSYAKAEAGAAFVQGAKGFVARSSKGVVIELSAREQGVSFELGGGTFTVTMDK